MIPSTHKLVLVASLGLALAGEAEAGVPLTTDLVADVAERVTPAVVNITSQRTRYGDPHHFDNWLTPRGGPPRPRQELGAGSGVVISPDGYIVTNHHVIEGADQIKVVLKDRTTYKAKLIGTDKPSDLALLKITLKKGEKIPYLEFGDSSKLRLGEFVLAIGNPFGVGQTLTMGIVSATGRANIGIVEYEDFIQTDAAINPGNSGGALVSLKGELVGVNTAILSRSGGAQGIGFAVPSTMAKPILDQIRTHGRVRRGWLGVVIQDLTPDLADELGLKQHKGVLISDVMKDGPAAKSELASGDVIIEVNGKATDTSAQLKNLIAHLGPGTTAALTVLKKGKVQKMKVKLIEKEDDEEPGADTGDAEAPLVGVELSDLSPQMKKLHNIPDKVGGVAVTAVEPGTPAAQAGVRPGDIITSVNRKPVSSKADLGKMLLKEEEKILLRIYRDGHYLYVVLRN